MRYAAPVTTQEERTLLFSTALDRSTTLGPALALQPAYVGQGIKFVFKLCLQAAFSLAGPMVNLAPAICGISSLPVLIILECLEKELPIANSQLGHYIWCL